LSVVEAAAWHDVGQEILVDDLDAAVDDRDAHPGAVGDLPGARDIQVLARRAAALAVVDEVPLLGEQRVGAGARGGRVAGVVGLRAASFVQAGGIGVAVATPSAGGQDERSAGDDSDREALLELVHLFFGLAGPDAEVYGFPPDRRRSRRESGSVVIIG